MPDMSSFESLKSIGTSPVTGDEFEHETELPGYSDIADEIARLDFDGVRAVNWEIVVRKSEIILRDHSKNLRIAIYMTYGLYETNGLPGFAAGLGVLADMVETFWQDLDPPLRRLRGRIMALEWLSEKARAALTRDTGAGEISDCETALSEANRLMDNLSEHAPEAGDALWNLVPVLKKRQEEIQQQEIQAEEPIILPSVSPAPAQPSPPVAQQPEPKAPAIPIDGDMSTSKTREQSLGALRSSLLDFVRRLRTADIADPRVYALHRVSIWLPIRELPPAINGKTELPYPSKEVLGAIETAIIGQNYAIAIDLCEDTVANSLFWLDGHRMTAEILTSIGHLSAAQAVRSETMALLHRLPALATLNFRDGTPFADPATRQWLSIVELQEPEEEEPEKPSLVSGMGRWLGRSKS